ncbi:hypothetical protein [Streptomyces kanamyceticus]|uniref:Uncharacterized protein n=1 Tax=Streptomyces kanamyceticus TaxID=1967 RepID=A0A5J6GSF9_STRKN|nr:hypothetical protein [Streptomyces kanamyceticus]QEU95926.1 hypothetical protein CP970_37865 [Streptomyces kanamyceticus]
MPTRSGNDAAETGRIALDRAETALLEHYTDLVRLAYLTLSPSLSRHRRVLAAHSAVQRAMPGIRPPRRDAHVPGQRRGDRTDRSERDWARAQVLRTALRYDRCPTGWPGVLPPPRALLPALPFVWGLQLFPRSGGADELALAQALSGAPAPARAAFVLCRVDHLSEESTAELLAAAGVEKPAVALRGARQLETSAGALAEALLRSREFDACSVQTRPTDLLRRRRRRLLACTAAGAAAITLATVAVVGPRAVGPSSAPTGSSSRALATGALDPARLVRTPRDEWADTARVDFTAWPARGDRTDDRDLLARALGSWAGPAPGTRTAATSTTPTQPPSSPPQLLYAGDVDDRTVVLFGDGDRIARYTEPSPASSDDVSDQAFVVHASTRDTSGSTPTWDVARTDDADVTTAAAVAVTRGGGKVRYLTAPWIAEAETRDLLRPDTPAKTLPVRPDGVTAPVAGADVKSCASRPVLQLRSSSRIVEKHSFLLTDLGGLSPVHLTHTPLPGGGTPPARQPREATSSTALLAWAHSACALDGLRGAGVRSVNAWDFAQQELPENGGRAVWTCARATTWRGPGSVQVQLRTPGGPPSAPARVVAHQGSTAACGRFGQHVVAAAHWKSGAGHWYTLAAGSRAVTDVTLSGTVKDKHAGRTLAVRAPHDARLRVGARLDNGETLVGLGEQGGTRDD